MIQKRSAIVKAIKQRILWRMVQHSSFHSGFSRTFTALFLVLWAGLTACTAARDQEIALTATAVWQGEVATRGVQVMPFDLERTTHFFEKREDGGLQQVVAHDATDSQQIALVRAHLAEEAERFRQGDFHDPAMIHGEDMAGLHQLILGFEQISIAYADLPDGAQILYTTDDAELITAIHAWFDAQVADHAGHATSHVHD